MISDEVMTAALKVFWGMQDEGCTDINACLYAALEAAGVSSPVVVCPFADPAFSMDLEAPCPVCGDLGTWSDEPSRCVSKNSKGD